MPLKNECTLTITKRSHAKLCDGCCKELQPGKPHFTDNIPNPVLILCFDCIEKCYRDILLHWKDMTRQLQGKYKIPWAD